VTLEYSIALDHSVWMPVPLDFPWNGYADADAWSTDLASSLLNGFDASPEVVAALGATAREMANVSGPFDGAEERFWHFPLDGGTQRLIHLYVEEYPYTGEAAWRALATAGVGGYVQVLEALDDTAFDEAARTVVIAQEGESAPIYLVRFLGFRAGMVFILEIVDEETGVVAALAEPAEALFRSIELREVSAPADAPER